MTLFDDDLAPATELMVSPDDTPVGGWPLSRVREWLRRKLDGGEATACPTCGQNAKVYKRSISAESSAALVTIWRAGGDKDFVHIPTVLRRKQADEAKLLYWGLLEREIGERPDGSNRTGYWKVTPAGVEFIHGRLTVPKYAVIYDGRLLRLEGEPITIYDTLGERFNYAELMAD